MLNVGLGLKKIGATQLSRRLSRFAACESGATTAEYVIIAAAVVALGVTGVMTTRGGATVSAHNTASAIGAQAPIFEDLAEGQADVRRDAAASGNSGSGTGSGASVPPGSNVSVMPPRGGVASSDESANDASDATAETGDSGEQQTADQSTDTDQSQDTGPDTDTSGDDTNTAENQDTAGDGSGGAGLGTTGAETEDDDTQVAHNVKPGCKNPYNKRGKIKRKCR